MNLIDVPTDNFKCQDIQEIRSFMFIQTYFFFVTPNTPESN